MSDQIQYGLSVNSPRIRKAKLSRKVRRLQKALAPFAGVLAILAVVCIATGATAGYSLLGAAVLIMVWALWLGRDVTVNAASLEQVALGSSLDQILAADVLEALPGWPVGLEGLLQAIAQTPSAVFIYNRFELHPAMFEPLLEGSEADSQQVMAAAEELARSAGAREINGAAILVAALTTIPGLKKDIASRKLKSDDLIAGYTWQLRLWDYLDKSKQPPLFGGIGRDWAAGYTPVLGQLAHNVSRDVESGVIHYATELHIPIAQQVIGSLQKPAGSGVALIGSPGVGKTSLSYIVAEQLLAAPPGHALRYYQVYSLDASAIVSVGGQVEELVLTLLAEAVHAKNVILLLDEAQLFFGEGVGAIDISQILLPILQQSPVKIMMSMTAGDLQRLSARMPSLTAAITSITVPEPSREETIAILQDAAIMREGSAKATVTYQALQEVYRLADRYLSDQAFPGKAVTVLSNAMGLPDELGMISPVSVQQAIERQVGVKVQTAAAPERDKLLRLEETIRQTMIGQTDAVAAVAGALRRSRAGVANPNRPIGSFLFMGPTGVGKTELTKALAGAYFGGRDQIVRLDMSEYQQSADVGRLLAATSSSKAGASLVGQIRKQPFSVVLLDEVEKAHPDVLNLLLQLLDEGQLTDSGGRKVSFKDAIIICTSNAGADLIRQKLTDGESLDRAQQEVVDALISDHTFKPELINRFDEIVLFKPLSKDELAQVVTLLVAEVNRTLAAQNVTVSLTPAAASYIVGRGYDPQFGARPMRRMVQRAVENIVADRLLRGEAAAGDAITLDVDEVTAALG